MKKTVSTNRRDRDKHCFPVVKPLHFLPLLPRVRGPQRSTLQTQENGLVSSCSLSLCCVTMAGVWPVQGIEEGHVVGAGAGVQ